MFGQYRYNAKGIRQCFSEPRDLPPLVPEGPKRKVRKPPGPGQYEWRFTHMGVPCKIIKVPGRWDRRVGPTKAVRAMNSIGPRGEMPAWLITVGEGSDKKRDSALKLGLAKRRARRIACQIAQRSP